MEIKNTKDAANKRVSVLIYGESGIGKTTLAMTLDGPTLIVSAESGLLSLADSSIDYIELVGKNAEEKLNSLRDVISTLRKGTKYKNIFIDSLTEIGQIMAEYQFEAIGNDRTKSIVAWGEYSKQIRNFIKIARDMAPYNIVITALAKSDKDEFNRIHTVPDLNGRISKQCSQYFDEVFHYSKVVMDDKSVRKLFTDSHDNCTAKDRSGKLEAIEEPNLQKIFSKIKGE